MDVLSREANVVSPLQWTLLVLVNLLKGRSTFLQFKWCLKPILVARFHRPCSCPREESQWTAQRWTLSPRGVTRISGGICKWRWHERIRHPRCSIASRSKWTQQYDSRYRSIKYCYRVEAISNGNITSNGNHVQANRHATASTKRIKQRDNGVRAIKESS